MPDYSDLTAPSKPGATNIQQAATPIAGDYSDLTRPSEPARLSVTGKTLEPMNDWQAGFQALSDRLTTGGAQFTEASAGWRLAAGAEMKDVEPDVDALKLEEIAQHREDFINHHAYMNMFKLRDLPFSDAYIPEENKDDVFSFADIPGMMIESIPSLAVGGGVGWGAGAAAATIFGTEALAVGGTALAIGSLPITAPLVGGFLGATALTGLAISGSHIYQSMKKGVPKDQAIIGGLISGAIGGAFVSAGQGILGHGLGDAAKIVISSGSVKAGARKLAALFAKNYALDVSAQTLQSAVDTSLSYIEQNMNDVEHPMTFKDAAFQVATSFAQAGVTSPLLGAVTHGAGIAAGDAQVKKHEAIARRVIEHQKQAAIEAQAKAAADATVQQARDTETQTNIANRKITSRKALSGFIEVNQPIDVPTAQANFDKAEADHTAQQTPQSKAALDLAKAELKEAAYSEQVNAIEDVLTAPDLLAEVAQQITHLENDIAVLEAQKKAATTPTDKAAFQGAIDRAQEQMRRVKALKNLGSHEKVKARIEEMQLKFQDYLETTRREVAIKTLEKDIASQDKDIAQLQAEIAKRKAAGKKTFRLEIRLNKRQFDINADKVVLHLGKAGLLSPDEFRKLSPVSPTAKLKTMVELAKKKVAQAAKLGAAEKAKEMKAAKKLIDAVISLARLDKDDKAKLKNKKINLEAEDFSQVLQDLQFEIEALFQKRRQEAARKDLKRELKDISDIDSKVKSAYPEVEGQLKIIEEFATNPDSLDAFLDKIAQQTTPLTDAQREKLALSALFPDDLKSLKTHEVEAILDAVIELKETGRTEATRRYLENKERAAKKEAEVWHRMGSGRKQKPGLKAQLDKILDDNISAEIKSLRGLMVMLSQFGDASDMADLFDVKGAFSDFHKERMAWENTFVGELEKQGISKTDWIKATIDFNRKVKDEITYQAVVDGGLSIRRLERPDGTPHTIWELIQIRNYLLDEDPRAVERLKGGNGYSYPGEVPAGYSTLESVEYYLDHNARNWEGIADTMRWLYSPEQFGKVVDEALLRRLGRTVEPNHTYGGSLHSDDGGTASRETFRRLSNKPASLNVRHGGESRVKINSALMNMESHIAQYTREKAFFELEHDLPAVLQSQAMKDRIARDIGQNTNAVINRYIEDIVMGQHKARSTVERVFSFLTNNLYSQFLAGRVEQVAKQATGAIHAMQKIGPAKAVEGWLTMLGGSHHYDEYVEASGLAQQRIVGRQPSRDPGLIGKIQRFNHFLNGYVHVGDRYGAFGAAFPVYLETLERTGDKALAVKEADTILDTTQASSSIDERPNLFRQDSFLSMLSFMAQEPTRQVEAVDTAIRQFKAGKASAKHVAKIMAVTWTGAFLYNAVGYALRYPFLDDEKREKQFNYLIDVAPLGPLSGIAVVGQLLASSMVSLLRVTFNQNTKAYEPELLPTNPLLDTYKLNEKTMKIASGEADTKDYWGWIHLAARNIGGVTGLPIENVVLKPIETLFPGVKE